MILSGETSAYCVFEDPSSIGTQSATALQSLLRAYVRTSEVINFSDSLSPSTLYVRTYVSATSLQSILHSNSIVLVRYGSGTVQYSRCKKDSTMVVALVLVIINTVPLRLL